jgi:hypothetical protein
VETYSSWSRIDTIDTGSFCEWCCARARPHLASERLEITIITGHGLMKYPQFWPLALVLVALGACSDDTSPNTDATDIGIGDSSPDVDAGRLESSCVDLQRLNECFGTECIERTCRGDEVCQAGTCVDWTAANLRLDFAIAPDEGLLGISVQVAEGGFPRAHVDALRFDFGDGIGGWGESLRHQYKSSGVYPVTLVVRMAGYRELRLTKLAVVNPADDFNPIRLTINQIPDYLNGSEPAILDNGTPTDTSDDISQPFTLQVPRERFDINVGLLDANDPIDRSSVQLSVLVDGIENDLSAELHFGDDDTAIWGLALIRSGNALPAGRADIQVSATTVSGKSYAQELRFESVELPPEKDPFDRPMVWLLRDDVDFFATTRKALSGFKYALDTTSGPNGVADFLEELSLMGAQGPDEAINLKFMNWIRTAVSTEIYRIFGIGPDGVAHDEIDLKLVWSNDPGAPLPADFAPTGDFSMMRLGGVFQGYLGYSLYAEFNEERINDSTIEFGVASAGVLTALTSTFGIADAFKAIHFDKGFPVGTHAQDAIVFANGFDPYDLENPEATERHRELKDVARYIALALAPVIAHEMGHAMGLMPNGLPPEGFFGNRPDVSFVGSRTNSLHADLPGLNLMQAGGDTLSLLGELDAAVERNQMSLIEVAKLLSLETSLSPLSRAYLQRKLTYTGNP